MDIPVIQRLGKALRTQRAEREFGMEALARMLEGYLPEEQIAQVRRAAAFAKNVHDGQQRSEEHTSELQSLMRISYAVFCLKKKKYIQLYLLTYHLHLLTTM